MPSRPDRVGVVLLAHGSPDARSADATRALARRVAQALDRPVEAAFLQHDGPDLAGACALLRAAGMRAATVVPVLLSRAFHARVDVPEAVAVAERESAMHLTVADALGPDAALLPALEARLPIGPRVLAIAGTGDPQATAEAEELAAAWQRARGQRVLLAHASQGTPDVASAIDRLEDETGQPAAVASFVLFPGLLPDRIVAAAAGRPVSGPLWDAPELCALIATRVTAAERRAA